MVGVGVASVGGRGLEAGGVVSSVIGLCPWGVLSSSTRCWTLAKIISQLNVS